ncbi:uncharacterized protein LOC127102448 [Lathyrus oleraceus]|uniref:uncharacterized protein LOC127102448 n=1 Tax=Pisum sativum TaxID=3888 RepID=UPI0021D016D3|nr:uncharacterized protein LOC127102448 [Pisum sativum]
MKEPLSEERKVKYDRIITLAEEFYTILKQKLLPKLTNPGRFTIPYSTGSLTVGHALCDLEANVNLMLLSMMRKLNCGEPKLSQMTLALSNRSITYPYGVLEYVLVRVNDLLFPADFVILDMPEDFETPLLLGRSFLEKIELLLM